MAAESQTSDDLERPAADQAATASSPCRHLRHKGMYVYTDGQSEIHGDYDNTIYWCLKTLRGFGPDDEMVSGEDCRDCNRTCYQPL